MICPIVTSPVLLQIPSTNATQADRSVGENLKETLQAHAHECVGMAANMIGVHKRIIVVADQNATHKRSKKILSKQEGHILPKPILMYNPKIIKFSKPYETKEGCLSLSGVRSTTRYEQITVNYLDEQFNDRTEQFSGFTAQIIQHEIDHCNGILI